MSTSRTRARRTWRTLTVPVAIGLAALVPAATGSAQEPTCEPDAATTVTDVMGADDWDPTTPALWDFPGDEVILTEMGTAPEGPRRPFEIATLTTGPEFTDVRLEAEVRIDEPVSVNQRDVVLVFGYRSPTQYYYAHLSQDNTILPHNGIFVVDDADRVRIDDQYDPDTGIGAPPAIDDTDWHPVELRHCADTGRIEVYVDGADEPLMTATDDTFDGGRVGFGSFDNYGRIRDLTVTGRPVDDGADEPGFDLSTPLWLTPGVTEQGGLTDVWSVDLRDTTRADAADDAEALSSRLYGPDHGGPHGPISFEVDREDGVTLGIHVDAVSLAGASLDVALDGEFFHRLTWERASSTIRPRTLFHLAVPPGEHSVSFHIADPTGVVVADRYVVAADPDDLEADQVVELQRSDEVPSDFEVPPPYAPAPDLANTRIDGYRGIWFELGQRSEHGDKYSGGLGTYTSNHSPIAVHAPEVGRTFFVYGGTTGPDDRHLLNMVSYYDHADHAVPRPTVVHDKGRTGVDDPHDNASIAIADDGHVWVFVSGRATSRPGFTYRSAAPYDVSEFERISEEEFTYPQPHVIPGEGFVHLFTRYSAGRELYWKTSDTTGTEWSSAELLAGFGGHYQVTAEQDGAIASAFNYHPDGDVDRRTNLYVVTTDDRGDTWTTADGTALATPLRDVDNAALVVDYEAQDRLVYTSDISYDQDGNPVVLYLTSSDHRPGPQGDPRTWHVAHWTGDDWRIHDITTSTHNYDAGSIYLEDDVWRVIAPTGEGPQRWGTGGEVEIWESDDLGVSWTLAREVTSDSERNHSYVRRPLGVQDPFYAFWADGDPDEFGPSYLHFGDSTGESYWQLPYDMDDEFATPIPRSDPDPDPDPDPGEPGPPEFAYLTCPEGAASGFADVPDDSVHAPAVRCGAAYDVLRGVSADRFAPRRSLTRGQAAAIVDRIAAATGRPVGGPAARFRDVPADHVHADAIGRLGAAGIVEGFDDGTFRPELAVRRDQLTSLLVRVVEDAHGEPLPSEGGRRFRDVPSDSVHAGAITTASAQGIVTGDERGDFRPRDAVRRDQAASIAVRAMTAIRLPD